jgi:hypothetical protein
MFKKRLQLDEASIVLDPEDCSVGNLKIVRCSTHDKAMDRFVEIDTRDFQSDVKLADSLLMEMNLCFLQNLERISSEKTNSLETIQQNILSSMGENEIVGLQRLIGLNAPTALVAGLGHTNTIWPDVSDAEADEINTTQSVITSGNVEEQNAARTRLVSVLENQMQQVLSKLASLLSSNAEDLIVSINDAVFVHLLLHSTDDLYFGAANREYSRWFSNIMPPSRCCIAVCMVSCGLHCH